MTSYRILFAFFLTVVLLLGTSGLEARAGDARIKLEKKGIPYNESSFTECAKKGDIEAVKLFLDEGIDINAVNKKGQTALIRAAEYQRKEVVTLLLEKGADVEFIGERHARTALMEAAGTGNNSIIKQLVEKGANVNAKDYENTTPLHFASMYGHVETVKLLIEFGANPNVHAAGMGRTPMSLAKTNGYTEVVQILKDAGAKE